MGKIDDGHALAAVGNYATMRQVNDPKMRTKVFEIDAADLAKDIVL